MSHKKVLHTNDDPCEGIQNPGSPSKGSKKEDHMYQVVSTHVSPTAQPPLFQSDKTDAVFTELQESKVRKGNKLKIHPHQPPENEIRKEDPVLAVYTQVSPDGQPPLFKSNSSDLVVTELHKTEHHGIFRHAHNNNPQSKHHHKFSWKHKKTNIEKVGNEEPECSLSGQSQFVNGGTIDMVVKELHKTEEHENVHENEHKHKSDLHYKGKKHTHHKKDVLKEDPVLAVYTKVSPKGQPPFFHSDTTDMVVTELHKHEKHHKQDKSLGVKKETKHSKKPDEDLVLVVSTHLSPTAQPPFFKSDTTNMVVTELNHMKVTNNHPPSEKSSESNNIPTANDNLPSEFKLY